MKNKCISYLKIEKNSLLSDFPKFENITEKVFENLFEFLDEDFDGISENKVFRCYLATLKEMIIICFEFKCSKVYMRSLFKKLNNKMYLNYVVSLMLSKSNDIKFISERLINEFGYWQNSDNTRDEKEKDILIYLDRWM